MSSALRTTAGLAFVAALALAVWCVAGTDEIQTQAPERGEADGQTISEAGPRSAQGAKGAAEEGSLSASGAAADGLAQRSGQADAQRSPMPVGPGTSGPASPGNEPSLSPGRTDAQAESASSSLGSDPSTKGPGKFAATIEGRALDIRGDGVEGLSVFVRPVQEGAGPRQSGATETTNSFGGFRLSVDPGSWRLVLQMQSGTQEVIVDAVASEIARVHFDPLPIPLWTVQVTGADDTVGPGSLVSIRVGDTTLSARQLRPALPIRIAPAAGSQLRPGARATITVQPGSPRYRALKAELVLPAAGQQIEVRLTPAPTLELTLEIEAGGTTADVTLLLLPEGRVLDQRSVVPDDGWNVNRNARLWSTGQWTATNGTFEARVNLGVDLDLPAVVRLEVTLRRPRYAGVPAQPSAPRLLDISLTAPVTRATLDLR